MLGIYFISFFCNIGTIKIPSIEEGYGNKNESVIKVLGTLHGT
jgi:hypothetical protein